MNIQKKKLIKTLKKGTYHCSVYLTSDGKVVTESGEIISEDTDYEDDLSDFESNWNMSHWDNSDYASYYGCNKDEVQDFADDDIGNI